MPRAPSYVAADLAQLALTADDHAFEVQAAFGQSATHGFVVRPGFGDAEEGRGAALLPDHRLHPFQQQQDDQGGAGGGGAQDDLAGAEHQSDHRRQPKGRRGGDAADHLTAPQDRAGADEADAREDAERQPHRIDLDEAVRPLAMGGKEQVGLRHRQRRGQAYGGAQAGRAAALAAVKTDGAPRHHRRGQAQGDVEAAGLGAHAEGNSAVGGGFRLRPTAPPRCVHE